MGDDSKVGNAEFSLHPMGNFWRSDNNRPTATVDPRRFCAREPVALSKSLAEITFSGCRVMQSLGGRTVRRCWDAQENAQVV